MGQELVKASLPGFEHLNEDLHVLVEYEGDASEREKCLSIASNLVAPLLVRCSSVLFLAAAASSCIVCLLWPALYDLPAVRTMNVLPACLCAKL